jgi:hypothetical protein
MIFWLQIDQYCFQVMGFWTPDTKLYTLVWPLQQSVYLLQQLVTCCDRSSFPSVLDHLNCRQNYRMYSSIMNFLTTHIESVQSVQNESIMESSICPSIHLHISSLKLFNRFHWHFVLGVNIESCWEHFILVWIILNLLIYFNDQSLNTFLGISC